MRGKSVFRHFVILGILLLGASIFVGCSEESVTPNDEITADQEDLAHQSGFLALAIVNAIPWMNDSGRAAYEDCDIDPFEGCIQHTTDPEHIWTNPGEPISWEPEELPGIMLFFEFDLVGMGDDPMLANGTGVLTLVDYVIHFTVIDVVVPDDGYPTGGTIEVVSMDTTGYITFHPDETATVEVGSFAWSIDLETGEVTPI